MLEAICRGAADCQKCPKSVPNIITHIFHKRGYHSLVSKCEYNFVLFLLEGELLVNSEEYAGVTLKGGEFILQAVGSKFEFLAMTEVECVYYCFVQPELFCEGRLNYILKEVPPPLIYSPLKMVKVLDAFLKGITSYLSGRKVCRELVALKNKELAFILSYYYTDYDLAGIVHPLSKYINSFSCFVFRNYQKVKTVE